MTEVTKIDQPYISAHTWRSSSRFFACPECRRPAVRMPSPSWRPKHPGRFGLSSFCCPDTRCLKIVFSARVNLVESKHGFGVGAQEWCPDLYPARTDDSQRNHRRLFVHLATSAFFERLFKMESCLCQLTRAQVERHPRQRACMVFWVDAHVWCPGFVSRLGLRHHWQCTTLVHAD